MGKPFSLMAQRCLFWCKEKYTGIIGAVTVFNVILSSIQFMEIPGWLIAVSSFVFIAILFFIALLVAALTSSVSLVEVGVAYLTEEKHLSRKAATWTVSGIAWAFGILCSLSFGSLSGIRILGNTIFDFFDKLSAGWLMPLGALIIVIFTGWKMKKSDVLDEFTNGGTLKGNLRISGFIYFLIKYLTPIAVLIIFLTNLL